MKIKGGRGEIIVIIHETSKTSLNFSSHRPLVGTAYLHTLGQVGTNQGKHNR